MRTKRVIIISIAILLAVVIAAKYWGIPQTLRTIFTSDVEDHNHEHKGHDHEHKNYDHERKGHDREHKNYDHERKDEESVIKLNEKQLEEFGIKLLTANSGSLETILNLTGEIVVDPDRLVHITPRIPGIVTSVKKKLGEHVQQGEVIAILESPQLAQAKIEYLTLKKQLELAEVDLQRTQTIRDNTLKLLALLKKSTPLSEIQQKMEGLDMGTNHSRLMSAYIQTIFSKETYLREKTLHERKVSSRTDFLQAESDYKKAQADYIAIFDEISFEVDRILLEKQRAVSVAQFALHTAERRLRVFGLPKDEFNDLAMAKNSDKPLGIVELKSPLTGIIVQKHVTLGEFLKEETTPFAIADLSSVWATLSVYQKDLHAVQIGQKVYIESKDEQHESNGEIAYISPTIDEKTRTATARVVVENLQGNWRPGLFIKARVIAEKEDIAVLIPKTAVQMIEDHPHVFVRVAGEFVARAIKLGRYNKTHVEVLSGLKSGQKYVADGGFVLKSEMQKSGFDHGHSH